MIAEMVVNPVTELNSALDLGSWLKSLAKSDIELLSLRHCGCTVAEIAAEVGSTPGRVNYRLQQLGFELAESAGISVSVGEKDGPRRKV